MFKDDNLSLYAYVLLIGGVVLGATSFAPRLEVAVTGIALNEPPSEEIETASLPPQTPPAAPAWNFPSIPWRGVDEGLAQMRATNKPGVLVLQADWCLECESLQEQFTQTDVVDYAHRYVFMLGDVDADRSLQTRFNVDGDYIPRVILLNPDGALRVNKTGDHPRLQFFVDPADPNAMRDALARGL